MPHVWVRVRLTLARRSPPCPTQRRVTEGSQCHLRQSRMRETKQATCFDKGIVERTPLLAYGGDRM